MKKPVPKRLCADPGTKYCKGHKNSRQPWGHRGCCQCHEHNAGDEWQQPCNPYLLSEERAELKIRWTESHPDDPWIEDDGYWRPKMKRRGLRRSG